MGSFILASWMYSLIERKRQHNKKIQYIKSVTENIQHKNGRQGKALATFKVTVAVQWLSAHSNLYNIIVKLTFKISLTTGQFHRNICICVANITMQNKFKSFSFNKLGSLTLSVTVVIVLDHHPKFQF